MSVKPDGLGVFYVFPPVSLFGETTKISFKPIFSLKRSQEKDNYIQKIQITVECDGALYVVVVCAVVDDVMNVVVEGG